MLNVLPVLPFLKKFAFRLTHNIEDTEDLVQDTVVKALTYQHSFNGNNLQGWMGRIMFNCFVDKNRRDKRINRQSVSDDVLLYVGVPAQQETVLELKLALEKVDKLPVHQRNALLKAATGGTYDELAADLQIPVGTIRSRLMRAREQMRL